MDEYFKKLQKDKEADIVWIENDTKEKISSILPEVDYSILDRKSSDLSEDLYTSD